MIEFYGEIALPCKQRADKLRKRHYALWTLALTLIVGGLAALNGATGRSFVLFTVFAALLAALTVYLFVAPQFKNSCKERMILRVEIEGDTLTVTRCGGEEVKKTRPLKKVKKAVLCGGCYYLYAPDAGSLVLCQRNLLKKGTFDEFEALFAGRLKKKDA